MAEHITVHSHAPVRGIYSDIIVPEEQPESTMDYVNVPDASASSNAMKDAAVYERKHFRLVTVSFGLLCILQAALNISLRLAFCEPKHYFQQGWVYLHPSFYYISSTKKSWQESREDCQQRGADLLIINSKEEQVCIHDFSRKFHKLMWIGLTQRQSRGIWKWVDGTLLTKSYWGPGEPNSYQGKTEDCAEIKLHDNENSWNDIPCGDQNFWICEKTGPYKT
uniref:CD209 antigen-like protein E n=1 Tax=Semicossyphus pulcher TaxID=241346 RepID=UPI0037E779BD